MEIMKTLCLLFVLALGSAADLPPKTETKTVTIAKDDLLVLQRNQAKIQVLQMQVQMAQAQAQMSAQPLVAENNLVLERGCALAGLKLEDCDINTDSGLVTKKAKPEPAKTGAPAK